MATISEENKKILRRSLDVIVGMDVPFVEVQNVTASGNYIGSSEQINETIENPILMDLSNGGFLNDGLAVPLGNETDGFVSQINTPLVLSVTLANTSDDKLAVIGYIGGTLHKWEFSGSGASRTATIPSNQERIIINRVICGEAFWFDNTSLISCVLQLRAVDTKADNPELQMSEIEFEGYEPNDITNSIGYIGTGYPIYYTSGYTGDMAPIRKFYLGEPIEFEDKAVKIKGYDATYFLDDEYGGVGVDFGPYPDEIGLYVYAEKISEMLTESGVDHEYWEEDFGEFGPSTFLTSEFFIEPQPKRSVIAQAVNIFRLSTGYYPFQINYIDAGIPKLWVGVNHGTPVTLENISRPKVIIDPIIKTVNLNLYDPIIKASSTIETVDVQGAAIYETSDPYYSFTSASGTITYLTPYSYKLEGTGSIAISGEKIELYAGMHSGAPLLPMSVTSGTNGIEIDLGNNYLFGNYRYEGFQAALQYLLQRSNISYEFEYRGDPHLQPRDYIRADIDGSGTLVDMTIDNIELKHEGGGTSSTIIARKGFI